MLFDEIMLDAPKERKKDVALKGSKKLEAVFYHTENRKCVRVIGIAGTVLHLSCGGGKNLRMRNGWNVNIPSMATNSPLDLS